MKITFKLNGRDEEWEVEPGANLLDVLRENGHTEVKRGCDTGDCGACTVLVDGVPRSSCTMMAGQAQGREITTIAGLGDALDPHPLQQAWVEVGAVQCGFCTPGMILSAKALLDEAPMPTEDQIKDALSGNLCRCTGYVKPIEAIKLTATRLNNDKGVTDA